MDYLRSLLNRIKYRTTSAGSRFDTLSRFLIVGSLIPLTVSLILRRSFRYLSLAFYMLAMICFVWAVWRAYSSKKYQRAKENAHFVSGRFYKGLRNWRVRFSQRKDYRFFRCPGCRRWLRVPRGRGKLQISCPGCGSRFTKKT